MRTKEQWRRRAKGHQARTVVRRAGQVADLRRFLASAAVGEGWVVVYDALPGELDLAALGPAHQTEHGPSAGSIGPLALTRTPDRGHELTVHPADGPWEQHRYGYRQPAVDAPMVTDDEIAAVVVPGLVFDRLGQRLGRGAGYYDRFLARLCRPDTDVAGWAASDRRPSRADGRPLLIGVTVGPVAAELPVEDHDVAMTHLSGPFGVLPVPLDPEVDGR